MKRKKGGNAANPYLWLLWGVLLASLAGTALVALCALLLEKQVIGFESIRFVNPGIKAVCALLAGFVGAKRIEKRCWLFGALGGLGFIVFTTAVFGLLSGGIAFGVGNLIDAAMCAFSGMLGGMLRNAVRG